MNGERILVCAYTNRAVDEALNAFKVAALFCIRDHFFSAYKSGRVVRKGTSVFPEAEPVIKTSDEVAESTKTELQSQLDEARRKLRDTEKNLSEMKSLAKKVEIRQRLQAEYDSQHRIMEGKSRDYSANDQKIGLIEKETQEKEREYNTSRDTGIIRWLTSIKRRSELGREIAALKRQRDLLKSAQPRLLREVTEQRTKLHLLLAKLHELEAETRGVDLESLKRMIQAGTEEIERLKRLCEDIEKSILDTPRYVINNALVIFATLSRAHIEKDLSGASFDRVFIDEASMASLPQLFLAGFLGEMISRSSSERNSYQIETETNE